MLTGLLAVAFVVCVFVVVRLWQRVATFQREMYIRTFDLPPGLFHKLRQRRPDLTLKDCQLVAHALRQFFLAHLKSGRRFVSMPSQVADDLWHEFILYTRNYQVFCERAFGRFLHHTPAIVLGPDRQGNAGLRRVWWWCCREDNINPRKPTRLPLLFALDAKLGIADGFQYVPDCDGVRRKDDGGGSSGAVHCGGDFSSSSVDGSTDGFGDSGGGGDSGGAGASGDSGGGDGGGGDGGGGGGCGGGGCGS
ncbi:MAG: hypothetical protein U1F10_16000 [Burkholderiales bacterium]